MIQHNSTSQKRSDPRSKITKASNMQYMFSNFQLSHVSKQCTYSVHGICHCGYKTSGSQSDSPQLLHPLPIFSDIQNVGIFFYFKCMSNTQPKGKTRVGWA